MNLKLTHYSKAKKSLFLSTNSAKQETYLNQLYYHALTQKGSYAFLDAKGNDLLWTNNSHLEAYAKQYPKNQNYWWAPKLLATPQRILQKDFLAKVDYLPDNKTLPEKLALKMGDFLFSFKTFPYDHKKTSWENAVLNYFYRLFKDKKIFYILASPASFWWQVKEMFEEKKINGNHYDRTMMALLEKLDLTSDYFQVNNSKYDSSSILHHLNRFLPSFLLDLKYYQSDGQFLYLNKYFLFSHLENFLTAQITLQTAKITENQTQLTAKTKAIANQNEMITKTNDQEEKTKLEAEKTKLEGEKAKLETEKTLLQKEKEVLTKQKNLLSPTLGGELTLNDADGAKIIISLKKIDLLKINPLQLLNPDHLKQVKTGVSYFPLLPGLVATTNLRDQGLFFSKSFYKVSIPQESQTTSDQGVDLLVKYKEIFLLGLIILLLLVLVLTYLYNFLGILITLVTAFFVSLTLFLFSYFVVFLTFLTFLTFLLATFFFLWGQIKFFTWFKNYSQQKTTLLENWRQNWKNDNQISGYFFLLLIFGLTIYFSGEYGSTIFFWLGLEIAPHLFSAWGKTILLLLVSGFFTYFGFFYLVNFLLFFALDRGVKKSLDSFLARFSSSLPSLFSSPASRNRYNFHLFSFFSLLALSCLVLFFAQPGNFYASQTVGVWKFLPAMGEKFNSESLTPLLEKLSASNLPHQELVTVFDGQEWSYGLQFDGSLSAQEENFLINQGLVFHGSWTFSDLFLWETVLFILKLWTVLAAIFTLFFFFKFGLVAGCFFFFFTILRFSWLFFPLIFFNLGLDKNLLAIFFLTGLTTSLFDFNFYQKFYQQSSLPKLNHFSPSKAISLLFLLFLGFLILILPGKARAISDPNKLWLVTWLVFAPWILTTIINYQFSFFIKVTNWWTKIKKRWKDNFLASASDADQEAIIKDLND